MAESSTSIDCLGCGTVTRVKQRRLVTEHVRIVSLWTAILLSCINIDEAVAKGVVGTHIYMCKKCFGAYERFLSDFDKLNVSMLQAATVLKLVPDPDSTRTPSTSSANTRKRVHVGDADAASVAKRIKAPVVQLGSKISSTIVSTTHKDRTRNLIMTPKRESDVKSIARGNWKIVVSRTLKDPVKREYIVECVGRILKYELRQLCSDKCSSLLRSNKPDDITNFKWINVIEEAQKCMPVLLKLLRKCTETPTERDNVTAVIGVIITILAKHRRPQLSLFQKVVSILLYSGHSSKRIFDRLNQLNLCVSHTATMTTLNRLSVGHDESVKRWRDEFSKMTNEDINVEEKQPVMMNYDAMFPAVLNHVPHTCDWSDDDDASTSTCTSNANSSAESSVCTVDVDDDIGQDESFGSPSQPTFSVITGTDCAPDQAEPNVPIIDDDGHKNADDIDDESARSTDNVSLVIGYKLVGDNIDKNVKPRYTRQDKNTLSLHYYHSYAVQDRVSLSGLSDEIPDISSIPLLSIPVHTILPSTADGQTLIHNFTLLTSRILVDNLKHFTENYSDVVDRHIKHAYYREMSQKSITVPLGIMLNDESQHDEMIEILEQLQQYSPRIHSNADHSGKVSGDKSDDDIGDVNKSDNGICEDDKSDNGIGDDSKSDDGNMSACDDIDINEKDDTGDNIDDGNIDESNNKDYIKLRCILLGGDQFSTSMGRRVISDRMNSTNDMQCLRGVVPISEDWHAKLCFLTSCFKLLFKKASFREKGTLYQLKVLLNRSGVTFHKSKIKDFNACDDFFKLIISSYVTTAAMNLLGMDDTESEPSNGSLVREDDWLQDPDMRKDTLYAVARGVVTKYVDLEVNFSSGDHEDGSTDGKFEYSRLVISVGLLYLEYCDAIKEGDGLRVLRCWRFMLLLFKSTNRVNYSIEAFTLLAQYHFCFSKRQAHQLVWGRFVNMHGLPAHNVPCDLYMEHLNRICKDAMKGLGANRAAKALVRVGKVVGKLDVIMKNFDEDNLLKEQSGRHKVASYKKDLKIVVKVLMTEKLLTQQLGASRYHASFKNTASNPFRSIDHEQLLSWMYMHLNHLIHGF